MNQAPSTETKELDSVEAEVRARQAPRERGHDRSHRPRQDDANGRPHEGAGREGHGRGDEVRRDRQGSGGAGARHHDRDGARRVLDRQAPLRARGLSGPPRLHQEHDHRRRADGRRDPGGVGRRRPDAADARARAARPPGQRSLHRGLPEQGRHGGRPRAARAGRGRGPGAAVQLRLPRRRRARDQGLRPEGARGRRRGEERDHGADRRRSTTTSPSRSAIWTSRS